MESRVKLFLPHICLCGMYDVSVDDVFILSVIHTDRGTVGSCGEVHTDYTAPRGAKVEDWRLQAPLYGDTFRLNLKLE